MVTNLALPRARSTHDAGPERRLRHGERRPASPSRSASPRRRSADGTSVKNIRQQTAADGQLDHDGRPHRHRQDRGGVRRRCSPRPRWRCSSALGARRAAAGVRDDGRARRSRCAQIAAFLWTRGGARARRRRSRSPPVLGWLLAEMLVAMLQHVFDPPPDTSRSRGGSSARSAAAAIAAAVVAARAGRRAASAGCRSARYCASSEGNGALRTSRARIRTAGE